MLTETGKKRLTLAADTEAMFRIIQSIALQTMDCSLIRRNSRIIYNIQVRNGDFRREEDKTIFPLLFTM